MKKVSLLRAIGHAEYNPATPVEERKGAPECVVSHPYAGGVCAEASVMEVWSLPFCRRHGEEAKLAALDEITMSLDGIVRGFADAEQQRYDRNEAAAMMLEEITHILDFDTGALEEAIAAAYPPEELEDSTDADTLRFDYRERGIMDGPYDWWSDAQLLSCRYMRQAHDRGLSGLLRPGPRVRARACHCPEGARKEGLGAAVDARAPRKEGGCKGLASLVLRS